MPDDIDADTITVDQLIANDATVTQLKTNVLELKAGTHEYYPAFFMMGDKTLILEDTLPMFHMNSVPVRDLSLDNGVMLQSNADGSALAYIDWNTNGGYVRLEPKIETGGIKTNAISLYNNDDYTGIVEGLKNDGDVYPFH